MSLLLASRPHDTPLPGIDLARRVSDGDADALDQLVRELGPPGYRLACALLQDRQAAMDAVQIATVKMWRKFDRLRAGADVKPWFLGIVANECRNIRRSAWVRRHVLTAAVLPIGEDNERDVDDAVVLRSAIGQLKHDDRVVLLLRYLLDLSVDETARALGLSDAGVRTRSFRAITRLRSALVKREERDG